MDLKRVFYLGNDDIFFDKLKENYLEYFDKKEIDLFLFRIEDGIDWRHEWPRIFDERIPHIIIVDFTGLNLKDQYIIDLVWSFLYFRKNNFLKSIPLVALFSSEEELLNGRVVYSVGFLYTYFKRDIDKTIYEDTAYLAFELERIKFDKYAIASGLKIPYHLWYYSSISNMNVSDIIVETDCDGSSGESLECNFNLFEDFKEHNFEIINFDHYSKMYNYTGQIELRIPYANPWDEIKEDSIDESTIETWIDFNKHKFIKKHPNVLVLQSNLPKFLKISSVAQNSDFFVDIRDYLDGDFTVLNVTRPKLIFMGLEGNIVDESKDPYDQSINKDKPTHLMNDINTLGQIISFSRTLPSYEPFIIVFNSRSSTPALRKAFVYDKIMAVNEEMTPDYVDNFLKIFHHNQRSEMLTQNYYIPPHDNRRIVEIKQSVIITSLTEHEITFLTEAEIPFYSILKLDEPEEIILTVIPPDRELLDEKGMNHYKAIINGVPELTLQTLRRFVNQLIDEEPKEFKYLRTDEDLSLPSNDENSDKSQDNEANENVWENDDIDILNQSELEQKEEAVKTKTISDLDPKRFKVNRKNKTGGKSKL